MEERILKRKEEIYNHVNVTPHIPLQGSLEWKKKITFQKEKNLPKPKLTNKETNLLRLKNKFDKVNKIWRGFFFMTNFFLKHVHIFNYEYLSIFQKMLKNWLEDFLSVYFSKDITPYIHVFTVHLPELIYLHKAYEIFTCEGIEKLNEEIKMSYRKNNNKHNTDLEFLKILIQKRLRIEIKNFDMPLGELIEILNKRFDEKDLEFVSNEVLDDSVIEVEDDAENDDKNISIIVDDYMFYDYSIKDLGINEWLNETHIDNVMIFFKEKYPHIDFYYNYKLRRDMWYCEKDHKVLEKTFHNTSNLIVILNCFNEHWVVLTNINVIDTDNNQSQIFVFDSFNSNYYIKALKPILRLMYPNNHLLQINRIEMNYRQQGTADCGLFCLGYAEFISRKTNPCNLEFDQSLMRAEYNNFNKTRDFKSQNFVKENSNLNKLIIKTFILALNNNLNEIVAALDS